MRRVFRAFVVCLLLAGCEDLGQGMFDFRQTPKTAATLVNLTASKVRVQGPYGFCVEPSSIRSHPDRASVLFGNCAAITGSTDQPQPLSEAIVAVTATRVAPEAAHAFRNTKSLEEYLLSSIGRASLSRSGKAESVEILDSFTTSAAVFLRMRDTAPGDKRALTPSFWRSVFALPEATVSISVRGLDGGSLSPREGLSVVRDFTANTTSALDLPL